MDSTARIATDLALSFIPAYRHGTIEQVLETLSKVGHAGGPNAGAVLKGIACVPSSPYPPVVLLRIAL